MKNKILIIYFIIIIKYFLFISSISCNNKGLFKLNNSIIKLENNENKINNVKINIDTKTFNFGGSLYFENLYIYYVEIIMSDYVERCNYMFYGCNNLEYINLQKFKDNSDTTYNNMFDNVPINVIVCIKEAFAASNIIGKLEQNCKVISCSENCKSEQKKWDASNKECVENCPNGYIINNSTHKICKCELDKCLTCPNVDLEKNLCTECNKGYYPKENDIKNLGEYINYYNEIEEGYYLDINIYKKCYYSCKACKLKGNETYHNYLECNSNYIFEININNYINCYKNYD